MSKEEHPGAKRMTVGLLRGAVKTVKKADFQGSAVPPTPTELNDFSLLFPDHVGQRKVIFWNRGRWG